MRRILGRGARWGFATVAPRLGMREAMTGRLNAPGTDEPGMGATAFEGSFLPALLAAGFFSFRRGIKFARKPSMNIRTLNATPSPMAIFR